MPDLIMFAIVNLRKRQTTRAGWSHSSIRRRAAKRSSCAGYMTPRASVVECGGPPPLWSGQTATRASAKTGLASARAHRPASSAVIHLVYLPDNLFQDDIGPARLFFCRLF